MVSRQVIWIPLWKDRKVQALFQQNTSTAILTRTVIMCSFNELMVEKELPAW